MNFAKNRAAESRLRAPRFKIQEALVVSSRTMGTGTQYHLLTSDISRSGMLLSWRHNVNKVPFRENTLIEMTIDPEGKMFNAPVSCLGKVVRKIKADSADKVNIKFGIQIVQIENTDLNEWEHCLDYLTHNAKHLITNTTEYLQKNEVEEKPETNFKRAQ